MMVEWAQRLQAAPVARENRPGRAKLDDRLERSTGFGTGIRRLKATIGCGTKVSATATDEPEVDVAWLWRNAVGSQLDVHQSTLHRVLSGDVSAPCM